MSQHDFIINNQTANAARLDINAGLQALASNNSGDDAPTTTYANMWWYETDTNLLKIRNEDDNAWINVAYVNQSTSKFEILDDTKVVTTSGTEVGILGDQASSTWTTGTSTTESLVSPAKIKAAIDINAQSSTSGAVGTYGLLYNTGLGIAVAGGTYSGSALRWASTYTEGSNISYGASSTAVSGTWRLMGAIGYYNQTSTISRNDTSISLFVRIS